MRQRRFKAYWKRLIEHKKQAPKRDELLKKLGAAQQKAGRIVKSLVTVECSATI